MPKYLRHFHTHISRTVSHGDLLDWPNGLRRGRGGRPRLSGVVVGVGVGAHRVSVSRQSPISTKHLVRVNC